MVNDIFLLFFIMVLVAYIYIIYQKSTYRQIQYDEKLNLIKRMVTISRINTLSGHQPSSNNNHHHSPSNIDKHHHSSSDSNKSVDRIKKRDTAVVEDPLYPPLGRMPRPVADQYLKFKEDGILGISTRDTADTFRLMAYMINSTDRSEKWNIYGRQKYRGSSQGDFYAIQQCNSTSACTKIDLNNDMILTNQLRDFYNLPSSITFSSPLFSVSPYDIVQLKTTLDYGPYY